MGMGSTPKSGEFRGKTVDAAIEAGLKELGLSQSEAEIEVLHPGSRGVLGIGAEDARVRVSAKSKTPPPPPLPVEKPTQVEKAVRVEKPAGVEKPTPAKAPAKPKESITVISPQKEEGDVEQVARNLLLELLDKMGIRANVEIRWEPEPDQPNKAPVLILNLVGHDLGVLIGRRGETLASLQYILRLMVSQQLGKWYDLVVDVEQYKVRRQRNLEQLARRMAEQAISTGRTVRLEPMPRAERRIIHLTLRDHPQVTSVSEGEGDRRKVTIVPKKER